MPRDMTEAERKTGSLEPRPQGRRGHGRFAGVRERVRERMAGKPDTTLDEPTAALHEELSVGVHRSPVGRLLHGLVTSHGKRYQGKRAGA